MPDSSLDTRVALVEKDITNLSVLFSKIDTAIEKMTEISSSIREILNVHETKLATQEQSIEILTSVKDDIVKKIDEQKDNFDEKFKALEDKLTAKIDEQSKRLNTFDYIKYFLMGLAVLVLAKLNIPLPNFGL